MNEIVEELKIEKMIYEIRGKQVMLDSDLAKLYQCSNGTKSINLAVKRHITRFPKRFMFQFTKDEYNNLKFQFETSRWNTYGGVRKLPYAFTEQGVAMLATVLRTNVAEEVSIRIMDAFVAMRKYIGSNLAHCLKQNINVPIEITKQKINNRLFYLYEFIDGYHKKKLRINDICLLVKTVSLLDKKVSIKDYQNDNIFAKVNYYVQYLKEIATYKINKKTIYELITKYESLDFSNLNFYLVHGDLSSQNMLWKNHTLYLIDFDEAIVATQEYEVISSVIKLCFHYNDFDIQLAKELLKEYENQMNLSIQNLKCMWEFYILKVILEKIALYQMGKIDLSDPRQKKDGWEKWLNLLNDSNLKQILFE